MKRFKDLRASCYNPRASSTITTRVRAHPADRFNKWCDDDEVEWRRRSPTILERDKRVSRPNIYITTIVSYYQVIFDIIIFKEEKGPQISTK